MSWANLANGGMMHFALCKWINIYLLYVVEAFKYEDIFVNCNFFEKYLDYE